MLSTALSEFAGAGFAGSKSRLAINLSLRQLMVPDLPRIINRMLAKHHIPPRQLILEVTESIFERRERSVIHATLNELSNRGIQLHIDDFGAGYSSLSRLHEMPIRALKIDKSFVQSMDERARAIIEGSVLIARRFHIEVTAEGVETMDQCLALQAIGVDSMQGYLFGKPEPGFSDGQQLKDVCRQVYGSAENPESAVSSRGF